VRTNPKLPSAKPTVRCALRYVEQFKSPNPYFCRAQQVTPILHVTNHYSRLRFIDFEHPYSGSGSFGNSRVSPASPTEQRVTIRL
jgi:hypothetical protein